MLGALAAEALSNADGEQDIEKQIEEALGCPCIADLKEGPCGSTFVHAFSCYIRSDPQDGLEKGMDCLDQFKKFQDCLKEHPEHVAKIMSDGEEAVDQMEAEEQGVEAATAETAETPPPAAQTATS